MVKQTNLDTKECGMCSVSGFVTVGFCCKKLTARTIINAKSHTVNTHIQFPVAQATSFI
jgi:hypothetical protein